MKKLSLVLALILVCTCCAFVACGDETDTSSADSSAASSATSSATSSAVSSEASSEASSEDASSEDVSSDASSEDSSTGDVSQGQAANGQGTNVAKGKSYTGGAVTAQGDGSYSANLTDGVASNEGTFDNAWYGLWYNAGSAAPSENVTDGVATITIDLGSKVDNINAVRVNLFANEGAGILPPQSIVAYVSDDGNNFTELGALNIPDVSATGWASLAVDNASGRYVKFVITVSGTWTFLNEIEVYAA